MMIPPMAYFLAEVKRELEKQKREEFKKLQAITNKTITNLKKKENKQHDTSRY